MSAQSRSLVDRFWVRVDKSSGCWLWTGSVDKWGYGSISCRGLFGEAGPRTTGAHRVAYWLALGLFDLSLFVCHRCDTPACVNPAHLFLGTAKDNAADRNRKDRTARGERSAQARLTAANVETIRERSESGVSNKSLAAEFGICRQHVSAIIKNQRWKHVAPCAHRGSMAAAGGVSLLRARAGGL